MRKIFEGQMSIRTLPTTLLHIFCTFFLDFQNYGQKCHRSRRQFLEDLWSINGLSWKIFLAEATHGIVWAKKGKCILARIPWNSSCQKKGLIFWLWRGMSAHPCQHQIICFAFINSQTNSENTCRSQLGYESISFPPFPKLPKFQIWTLSF